MNKSIKIPLDGLKTAVNDRLNFLSAEKWFLLFFFIIIRKVHQIDNVSILIQFTLTISWVIFSFFWFYCVMLHVLQNPKKFLYHLLNCNLIIIFYELMPLWMNMIDDVSTSKFLLFFFWSMLLYFLEGLLGAWIRFVSDVQSLWKPHKNFIKIHAKKRSEIYI